jgi:hypothetical protein
MAKSRAVATAARRIFSDSAGQFAIVIAPAAERSNVTSTIQRGKGLRVSKGLEGFT